MFRFFFFAEAISLSLCEFGNFLMVGCWYVSVDFSTCQYVSVRVSTCQYVSVRVSTCQYVSVRVSTCQYVSVHVSMCQHVSLRASMCPLSESSHSVNQSLRESIYEV